MFALAILLLVAAAALILWVVFGLAGENNNQIHFNGFGFSTDLSPITLFALGALALLLVWAATRLITSGTKRGMRKRRERKELEKEHKLSEKQRVAAERERNIEADRRESAEARQRIAERDAEYTEGGYSRPTTERVVVRDEADLNTDGRHYRD